MAFDPLALFSYLPQAMIPPLLLLGRLPIFSMRFLHGLRWRLSESRSLLCFRILPT